MKDEKDFRRATIEVNDERRDPARTAELCDAIGNLAQELNDAGLYATGTALLVIGALTAASADERTVASLLHTAMFPFLESMSAHFDGKLAPSILLLKLGLLTGLTKDAGTWQEPSI